MQGSHESDVGYKPIPGAKDKVKSTQNTETGNGVEIVRPNDGLTTSKKK